ncbi:hypothetical protein ACLPHM_06065 [Paenalcaligenes sp. Me131]|uniref:hypothetical protein n=1 Tax=Paenalcaligenes sp. Me131 TaxID=3392636 RepID=UPI003D2C8C2E
MQTLVAKYEDDPPGVVFTFLVSGEKLWGWVARERLEVLAGKPLSIQGCIDTYYAHKEQIQRFVLQQKSQQESHRESLMSRLIKGLWKIGDKKARTGISKRHFL